MSLLDLQQDFRQWLTAESSGIESRVHASAAPGLAVYLNNYRAQLMACLAESFAVVASWIGADAFSAAAAVHIDRVPPHSWTLDDYALNFPETLATLYPEDPEVVDLGRLEYELGLAFTGADSAPVDPATLAGIDWDAARICFVPTFRLIQVRTNAAAIWSAIRAGNATLPPPVLPGNGTLAVWRREFAPMFRMLAIDEAEALSRLRDGASFAMVCEGLVHRFTEEQGPAIAGGYLRSWLNDGLVARIDG
ncbi:MAG: DNA-binding domain-containing protein [Steroidobacteraceae bacterium]